MFISKLTKRAVSEGQGIHPDGPWLGEPYHRVGYLSLDTDAIKDFIRKLREYRILVLNKGRTNNETVAQFVLGTLTKEQIKRLRFVPIEEVSDDSQFCSKCEELLPHRSFCFKEDL
jgi:hypothetical protein